MRIEPQILVERFYDDVWNKEDEQCARQILHPDFQFRGSLGPETRGPSGFIDYVRSVHGALANYTCRIDDLVAAECRIAARMTFSGRHRARFLGVEATGREITWAGAAFFKTNEHQITELWVLGDIDSIRKQLNPINNAQTD